MPYSTGIGILIFIRIIVVLNVTQMTESLSKPNDRLFPVNEDISSKAGKIMDESDNNAAGCFNSGDIFFNRRYFRLRKNEIYYYSKKNNAKKKCKDKRKRWGQSPILIQDFTMRDVVRCLDIASVQKNNRPLHIAFIGDSTIRQYFISFLRLIPDYDRKITRYSNIEDHSKRHHDDRNITSELFNNLRISFYWRNLITNNLIDDFKYWALSKDEAPDFILLVSIKMNDDRGFNEELEFYLNDLDEMNYELKSSDDEEVRRERRIEVRGRMVPFNSRLTDMYDEFFNDGHLYKTFRFDKAPFQFIKGITAHHILENDYATYEKLLKRYLVPTINISMKAHPQQQVIWLRLHTNSDQFFRGAFYTETIDMYNKVIRHTLKNTQVVIWDAINVIVEEYLRACALTRYDRRDNEYVIIENGVDHGYINCNDFIHPGMRAISIGAQLIINHICQ